VSNAGSRILGATSARSPAGELAGASGLGGVFDRIAELDHFIVLTPLDNFGSRPQHLNRHSAAIGPAEPSVFAGALHLVVGDRQVLDRVRHLGSIDAFLRRRRFPPRLDALGPGEAIALIDHLADLRPVP